MAISKTNKTKDMHAYKKMYLARATEQQLVDLYYKNRIMSFVHFYIGQEAVAVGIAEALKPEDKMMGNHRSHGHYLAKGGDLKAMVCELLGKAEGSSHGKGGSMHMIDKKVNFIGSTPILGSVVPLASGVAFEQKVNKRKGITVAFLGDGAFEEGSVYETINLAGLFKLPLLLVVENNLYAVNTKLKERRAPKYNTKGVVEGLGAKYAFADGNNYHDVRKNADKLISYVRSGKGPAVLECEAFRHMAHSAPIMDESVRSRDKIEIREEKDSLKGLRKSIIRAGVDEKLIEKIEKEVSDYVTKTIEYAMKAPFPKKKTLHTNVYV